MTRIEIASAVEEIVAAVANEHGLFGACDVTTPESTLYDQLGMDEADIIELILRAENRFGINLPDNGIGFSSTLTDVVDLIAERLSEKQASLARAHTVGVLAAPLWWALVSKHCTSATMNCPPAPRAGRAILAFEFCGHRAAKPGDDQGVGALAFQSRFPTAYFNMRP